MRRILFVILLILTASFTLQCGWWELMVSGDKELVIRGDKVLENETLVLSPGTTVIIHGTSTPTLQGDTYSPGKLTIGENAALIAIGTPQNPIVFRGDSESGGYIYILKNSSPQSVIKFCKFEYIGITCEQTLNISYSKFFFSGLELYDNFGSIIYNDFDSGGVGIFYTGNNQLFWPLIKYNNIYNSHQGIACYPQVVIESNNIINSESYAIFNFEIGKTNFLLAKNNYINNCDGLNGIDTNGSQCYQVTFSNYYRTEPVPDAGCGW